MSFRIIILDGRLIRVKASFLERFSPGYLKAKGVFETMRVCWGKIPLLEQHLSRFFYGLRRMKISCPVSESALRSHIAQVLGVNQAKIRLMVWKKKSRVHWSIVCQPLEGEKKSIVCRGWKAMISPITHYRNLDKGGSAVKSLDYGLFLKAYTGATRRGFDEAILMNKKKELVEGSRTNIFFVKDNVLRTPPLVSGCLNGIARHIVLRWARDLGIRCCVRRYGVQDLLSAQEAFVTNAVIGVMPLMGVGKEKIGNGKLGIMTYRLRSLVWKGANNVRTNSRA